MNGLRSALVAVCLIGMVGSSVALAQTTPPPTATEDTKSWTSKKWSEMKAKWAKEKEKYKACRKEGKDKGLKGKELLVALKDCMTN